MSYDSLFANPTGRTSRAAFIPALVVLVLVAAFYQFIAQAGRNGDWVLVTLLFPAFVLHARRLHDIGKTAWLLLVPGILFVGAIWQHMSKAPTDPEPPLLWAALGVAAVFMIWGLLAKGQADGNRFGEPAAS